MARYVDADKLKIWWDERYSEKDTVGVNQVISSIENCPSADVVEVKRGRWTIKKDSLGFIDGECSKCGYTDCFDNDCFYNFCPNCGADMRPKGGIKMSNNTCISCGEIIPEGRVICPICDADSLENNKEVSDNDNEVYVRLTDVKQAVEQSPTADVVDVVRCKDCKYWQDNNGGYPHEYCKWNTNETPDADDFCSCGERQ